MKKLLHLFLLLPFTMLAQVGVNTTTPNAALDVTSANNGILIPRVALTATTDATTVVNPAGGPLTTSTLVYNTATDGVPPDNVIPGFYYWNNSASRWIAFSATAGWELDGNTAIVSPAVPTTYGTSTIGAAENFIGTTDNNDVTIGTNNIERMRVKNTTGNIGIGTANPTEKLHVVQNSNSDKNSILSEVSQISSGVDYQNIAVKGFARGFNVAPGNYWGYANGVMGIGDFNNSYYATGVYAHLGSTAPILPGTSQALFANGNNLGSAGIFMGGNVGIGTQVPTNARLQVEGMVGNTSAIFKGGANSLGISMVSDWPGLYFNSYYNGGILSMANSGFASIINTDQATGGLMFQTTDVANVASGAAVAVPERMRITGSGNVGIGLNPTYKLDVLTDSNRVANFTNNYIGNINNYGVFASSINNPGYGFGGYFIGGNRGLQVLGAGGSGAGTTFGVRAETSGTGVGTRIAGYFLANGGVNNYGLIVPASGGNVGFGTAAPTTQLHVNATAPGAVRIVDGTQANGRVLTSNATGVATWEDIGITNVVGFVSGTGINIPYNTGPYLQTGSRITLPPGRFAVNVNMLMAKSSLIPSPNNSFFWVRTSFSDSAGINPTASPDIVGSNLISGNYPGTSVYSMLTGTVVINNTSGANKTYYYIAGNCVFLNTTDTITGFGSTYWAEDNIIAYRLN